ncbi:MAG: hypothetical protein R2856_13870 [Caldilineaceae bacterium]
MVFFAMAESGFVFPRALPEEVVQWFRLLSLASVLGYIAMIAWFFEMLRRTSMQQVNSTMDQLKLLNQELIQARDDAHAAAQAKSAFRLTMSHDPHAPQRRHRHDQPAPGDAAQCRSAGIHAHNPHLRRHAVDADQRHPRLLEGGSR